MSMNLHIHGMLTVTGKVKGVMRTATEYRNFSCFQTPTVITNAVLDKSTQDEMVTEYTKWVMSVTSEKQEPIFDYEADMNDEFEYPIIGYQMVHSGKDHITELRKFIVECEEDGFDVEFYTL
jgi:hypothetical protein